MTVAVIRLSADSDSNGERASSAGQRNVGLGAFCL
jgi:hypothetical protein